MGKSYKELSKAKIQDKRNIVISKVDFGNGKEGSYTLAQQLEVDEGKKKTNVFLKGSAIIIDDVEKLVELRNAIDSAIYQSSDSSDIEF